MARAAEAYRKTAPYLHKARGTGYCLWSPFLIKENGQLDAMLEDVANK